jgi:hypothetical protein
LAKGGGTLSAELRARQAFEELQQHARAMWLLECNHFIGEHEMQLDALDQLGRFIWLLLQIAA